MRSSASGRFDGIRTAPALLGWLVTGLALLIAIGPALAAKPVRSEPHAPGLYASNATAVAPVPATELRTRASREKSPFPWSVRAVALPVFIFLGGTVVVATTTCQRFDPAIEAEQTGEARSRAPPAAAG